MLASVELTWTGLLILQALTLAVQLGIAVATYMFLRHPPLISANNVRWGGGDGLRQVWESKLRARRDSLSNTVAVVLRYALAPTSVLVALLVSIVIQRTLQLTPTLSLWFMAAVAATVWYGGLGPGVLAIVLSAAAAKYFILPEFQLLTATRSDLGYLVLFVSWALLIGWMSSRRRAAEGPLRQLAEEWKRRWESSAEVTEANKRLQHEVIELQERIKKLEEELRSRPG